MKWINVRVDCLDEEGVLAASLTGDIPYVYYSLKASYNNKTLPRMAYESLLKGEIRISFAQACSDKSRDWEKLIDDYSISASDFVEKFTAKKFLNFLSKYLLVSTYGSFLIRPYFERYNDENVLKEYSENE